MSDNESNDGFEIHPRIFEQFEKSLQISDMYTKLYDDLAKKNNGLFAFASITKTRDEIERLIKEGIAEIHSLLTPVREYLELDLVALEAINTKNEILGFIGLDFPKALHEKFLITEHEIAQLLRDFAKLADAPLKSDLVADFYYACALGEILEDRKLHLKLLNDLIINILDQNYPNKLGQVKANGSKGRPDDPSAPQKPIQDFIDNIITRAKKREPKYAKYWHFSGAHKGTPNKNQIIQDIGKTGLTGELSDDSIKDRVYRAVQDLGY